MKILSVMSMGFGAPKGVLHLPHLAFDNWPCAGARLTVAQDVQTIKAGF